VQELPLNPVPKIFAYLQQLRGICQAISQERMNSTMGPLQALLFSNNRAKFETFNEKNKQSTMSHVK
jgi:hypothetical protein